MNNKVAVFRKEHFNAAHRLFNPAWDDRKNSEVFGKCSYPNYHGHNYEVIVKVTGEPDPQTGYVMDMKALSGVIKEYVLDVFDHKNLNLDTQEFRELNPTTENLVKVIWRHLAPRLTHPTLYRVTVHETDKNAFSYYGEGE